MNRNTRKMLLNLATGIAVATAAAVVFLPSAQAAPGTVTSNVNVRSGPGTNFAVIDTLARGTTVDVRQCQRSFCEVRTRNGGGWVSSTYLAAGGRPVNPSQPGLSFGFSVGPNGPNINIGVGQQPQIQPPRPPVTNPRPPRPPRFSEVCFYDRSNFRGESACFESGDSVSNLGRFADRISSFDNPDGLSVQVCSESGYRNCRTYSTSASSLGDYDDYIVSLRVR